MPSLIPAGRGSARAPRWLGVGLAAALAACDAGTGPTASTATITDVTVDATGGSIFRTLEIRLDTTADVRVDYWADGVPRLRTRSRLPASQHHLFLPRLRANTSYAFEAAPLGPDGEFGVAFTGTMETGALPPDLAALRFDVTGTPTFPLVLLENTRPTSLDAPLIVDGEGNIVWYWDHAEEFSHGATRRESGDFVLLGPSGVRQVAPNNSVSAALTEGEAATRTGLGFFEMHHDVIRTPDDHLLFLANDTATVADTVWWGEAIWEWDPLSDELTKRWTSFDFLSPTVDRGPRTEPSDWLHANSLSIGPRGNVLVSFFWTHEVISIAPDFQSLEWRLGGANSSFVVADGAMDAGQHTAAEVSPDRVLLFDNGLDRPGGEQFSRAIELELDRAAGTAQIVWEFRPEPDIFAPIVSSARRLENGNTVVGFGIEQGFAGIPASGPVAVFEVTPAGEIVWRMIVEGVNLLYRATPLFAVGGETEVSEGTP